MHDDSRKELIYLVATTGEQSASPSYLHIFLDSHSSDLWLCPSTMNLLLLHRIITSHLLSPFIFFLPLPCLFLAFHHSFTFCVEDQNRNEISHSSTCPFEQLYQEVEVRGIHAWVWSCREAICRL